MVTGGTGGLGSSVCKGLAEAGVNLAIADISEERLKERGFNQSLGLAQEAGLLHDAGTGSVR